MPPCHSSLCVYLIPPSPLDDITLIIITIMYGFSGSIVALWVSACSCIIVGTLDGLIAAIARPAGLLFAILHVFFLSPWLVNNAGHLCGNHLTHLGDDEKRKCKINSPFVIALLAKHPHSTSACCCIKLLKCDKIQFFLVCLFYFLDTFSIYVPSFLVQCVFLSILMWYLTILPHLYLRLHNPSTEIFAFSPFSSNSQTISGCLTFLYDLTKVRNSHLHLLIYFPFSP